MRRTPRFQVVARCALCCATALSFQPGHCRPPAVPHGTVEPTLPLAIGLKVSPADIVRGEPAHLQVTVDAAADLPDVSLTLILPEGLQVEGGLPGAIPHPGALRSGEERSYSLPLAPLKAGDLAIKVEASFRLPDGRMFRTGQGTLWQRGPAASPGRHNAGAYEVMGVPVDEPQP